jgi:hypothetical protein
VSPVMRGKNTHDGRCNTTQGGSPLMRGQKTAATKTTELNNTTRPPYIFFLKYEVFHVSSKSHRLVAIDFNF